MGHNQLWLSAIVYRMGKRNKWEKWAEKQTESFFFCGAVIFILILFIFFFQSTVESHLIYLNDEYEFVVVVWSQVAHEWRQDWPRRTARQIVILPANLTLSSERLMFLGKSHSTCCPVSSLQLAWAYGWMTEQRKMGSSELIRKGEGMMWVQEYELIQV